MGTEHHRQMVSTCVLSNIVSIKENIILIFNDSMKTALLSSLNSSFLVIPKGVAATKI